MNRILLVGLVVFLSARISEGEDTRPAVSRMLPEKGLTLYVEYDGLVAHSESWKATAAYDLIHKLPTGLMIADISKQIIDRIGKSQPEFKVSGDDLIAIHDHFFQNGFAVAVYDRGKGPEIGVLVLRGFGNRKIVDRCVPILRQLDEKKPESTRFRGRDFYHNSPEVAEPKPAAAADPIPEPRLEADSDLIAWLEGDDLIVIAGPAQPDGKRKIEENEVVASVLDVIEGKKPNAFDHPGRRAALAEGRDIGGFESNGLFFLEAAPKGGLLATLDSLDSLLDEGNPQVVSLPGGIAIPPAGDSTKPKEEKPDEQKAKEEALAELKLLGIDQVGRLVGRWGFQGKALLWDAKLELPAPRKGVAAFFDQPTFSKDKLPAFPKGTGCFAVGSFDPGQTWDRTIAGLKMFEADKVAEIDESVKLIEKTVLESTGQRLREDLLADLGPTWCLYASPDPRNQKAEDAIPTLIIDVDDPAAFARTLDALADRLNKFLRDSQGEIKPGDPDAIALVKLPPPSVGYRLSSPAGLIPWLNDDVEPTILLGKSFLVIATNAEVAMAAADSKPGTRWTPDDELSRALACLPTGLTSLSVGNPADSSWPEQLASLPKTIQYLGNFLDVPDQLPAGATPGSELLTLLGVPRAGGFRVRVDRSHVPKPDEIRALLFPSILATAIDEAGIRIICRESVPNACLGGESNAGLAAGKGQKFNFKVKYGPGK